MSKPRIISGKKQVEDLRRALRVTSEQTRNRLRFVLEREDFLQMLKFEPVGCDPLRPDAPQNLGEQIDQQATYEVGLDALEYLVRKHPMKTWQFAPGADGAGHDIRAEDGSVVAEVFAAVHPRNNAKLRKDIRRLAKSEASHRYVFFRAPGFPPSEAVDGSVLVVSLGQKLQARN